MMEIVRGDDVVFDPETHVYSYGGVEYPSVTTIIKDEWPLNTFFYERNPQATNRGSDIHTLTEEIDRGEKTLDDITGDPLYKAVHSWVRFVERIEGSIETIEERFINLTYGYAGTMDRMIGVDGVRTIFDIKSGSPAKWHELQIGAYGMSASKIPEEGYIAYLKKSGGVRPVKVDIQRAMDAWAGLMGWINHRSSEGLFTWSMYRSNK